MLIYLLHSFTYRLFVMCIAVVCLSEEQIEDSAVHGIFSFVYSIWLRGGLLLITLSLSVLIGIEITLLTSCFLG